MPPSTADSETIFSTCLVIFTSSLFFAVETVNSLVMFCFKGSYNIENSFFVLFVCSCSPESNFWFFVFGRNFGHNEKTARVINKFFYFGTSSINRSCIFFTTDLFLFLLFGNLVRLRYFQPYLHFT